MRKKNGKPVPLSDWEHTAMWMSIRYCIGRRSIATVSHAADTVRTCYARMTEDQREATAHDIWNELKMHLGYMFNMRFDMGGGSPFDCLAAFCGKDGRTFREMSRYRFIKCHGTGDGYYTFDTGLQEEDGHPCVISQYDVKCLLEWDTAARMFDDASHFTCTLIDGTEVECVRVWRLDHTDQDLLLPHEFIMPVDRFGGPFTYIPKENIKDYGEIK